MKMQRFFASNFCRSTLMNFFSRIVTRHCRHRFYTYRKLQHFQNVSEKLMRDSRREGKNVLDRISPHPPPGYKYRSVNHSRDRTTRPNPNPAGTQPRSARREYNSRPRRPPISSRVPPRLRTTAETSPLPLKLRRRSRPLRSFQATTPNL